MLHIIHCQLNKACIWKNVHADKQANDMPIIYVYISSDKFAADTAIVHQD